MRLLISTLLFLLPILLVGQSDSTENAATLPEGFFDMLTADPLIMEAPSEEFVRMEQDNGYEHPELKAKLAYIMLPVPYERMEKDMQASLDKGRPGMEVLGGGVETIGNHQGLAMRVRMKAPPEEELGDFLGLMFIIPAKEGTQCVSINAIFPESHQDQLEPLMMKSIGECRVRDE